MQHSELRGIATESIK